MNLATKDQIREWESINGKGFSPEWRSGRSTVIALETIAMAMRYPRKPIRIRDHHGTVEADRVLSKTILRILSDLRFGFFKVSKSPDGRSVSLVFDWAHPAEKK